MPPLAALMLATPIFGLSLQVDPALLQNMPGSTAHTAHGAPSAPMLAINMEDVADDGDEAAAPAPPANDIAAQIARRRRIGRIHRGFGIATWLGMTATTVLGFIQYNNLYGFFAAREDTPCFRGSARPNNDACSGMPAPHLATALVTGALYYTTFGLSYAMPDPLRASEGDGAFARRLRKHKIARWIHFVGMASQIILGAFVANADRFGINRSENYRALQGLATVHMAVGLVTYGSLTYAAAIMLR